MSSSTLKILQRVTLHEIIDIPDKLDKSSLVLVKHFKFVRANYLGQAADGKIHFIVTERS